jgi:hypothetical protein
MPHVFFFNFREGISTGNQGKIYFYEILGKLIFEINEKMYTMTFGQN